MTVDCTGCIQKLDKKNDKHPCDEKPPLRCRHPPGDSAVECTGCKIRPESDHPLHDAEKGGLIQTWITDKRKTAGSTRGAATTPSGDGRSRYELSDLLDLNKANELNSTARSSTATHDALPAQEENSRRRAGRSVGPEEPEKSEK